MSHTIDTRLKERLRAVLDREPVTEAELRKLAEDGRTWARLAGARLEKIERTLADLSADPNSSLTEIADALRDRNELRPDLDELQSMLAELHRRAREFRQSWVATR